MNPKDYRRQVEREIEAAAQLQRSEQLEDSAPANAARSVLESNQDMKNPSDMKRIDALLEDKSADPEIRAAALSRMRRPDDRMAELDQFIMHLSDPEEAPEVRMKALGLLEAASLFDTEKIAQVRPAFMAALRGAVDTDDQALREAALGSLARAGDISIQQRLLEGVENPDEALVPVATALQLLSYDIHAGVQSAAREILRNPPDEDAKLEAIRILATDGESVETFKTMLRSKTETLEARRLAAAALRSLAPETFRDESIEVLADENDDASLRASVLSGLTQSDDFVEDEDLRQKVQEISDAKLPPKLKSIADERLRTTGTDEAKSNLATRRSRRQRE